MPAADRRPVYHLLTPLLRASDICSVSFDWVGSVWLYDLNGPNVCSWPSKFVEVHLATVLVIAATAVGLYMDVVHGL